MTNLIAFGQPITHETVVITRDQQRNCLKCLINSPVKDSIIIVKDSIIMRQSAELIKDAQILQELDRIAYKSKKQAIKHKKQRNRVTVGGLFFGIAAFILGVII